MAPKYTIGDAPPPQKAPASKYTIGDAAPAASGQTDSSPGVGDYLGEAVTGIGRGLGSIFTGLGTPIVDTLTGHPFRSSPAAALYNMGKQMYNAYQENKGTPQVATDVVLRGLENAPVIGPGVQHAETGGTGFFNPQSVGGAFEAGTPFAAAELAPKVIPPIVRKTSQALTRTGPAETANLVKQTQAANADAAAEAAKANEKAAQQHLEDTQDALRETRGREQSYEQKVQQEADAIQAKHNAEVAKVRRENAETIAQRGKDLQAQFEKERAVREAETARQGQASRKAALQRGVEQLDPKFQEDLGNLEKKVNGEANQKYKDLNAVLKDKEVGPHQPLDEAGNPSGEPVDFLEHMRDVGIEPLRGTEDVANEPPIIKSLTTRIKNGDTLTYNDLQGYREELGRELRKGSLRPDVFTSYKNMLKVVDDGMQQIASSSGMLDKMMDARKSWRQYAETFLDRVSPVRKALDATERGKSVKALQGKDQSGIQAIAAYDPALAQRANTIRGYQAEAAGIRPSTAQSKPVTPIKPAKSLQEEPTLPDTPENLARQKVPQPERVEHPNRPAEVVPEKKTIGPEDIAEAKKAGYNKAVEWWNKQGTRAIAVVNAYDAYRALKQGNFGHALMAGVEGGISYGALRALNKFLTNEKVVDLLTRPTPQDIARIPEDMRRDLPAIVKAAEKKGIKVSPIIYATLPRQPEPEPQQ